MSLYKSLLKASNSTKKSSTKKSPKLLVIILTVAALAVAGLTVAAVTINQNISSSGTINAGPNIGVYSNSACTTSITSLNWGSVEAGGNATQTIYVKNTGTASVCIALAVNNWSPSTASTYMTLSWNQQGTQLSAGASTAATLTLTVLANATGITSFSNTISISGTG